MNISIILPVLNEEENLQAMNTEIVGVVEKMDVDYEIIYIDDGSTDRSFEILSELREQNKCIKVIQFRRNFGQTAGLAAGFDHASGDVIITMDSDRQNDPNDIPMLLDKINEGYDLVSGWRFDRQDAWLSRKLPSKIANGLISKITGVKLHDYGCSLKAFRKEVIENIRLYGEMHRFIPAIASWMGVRIAEVKVNHRARVAGTSKYGISRTFRVILDLITVKFLLQYSARPIHFFGGIGMASGALGFAISFVMTIQRFFYDMPMGDRPLLLLAVLLMFIGLQFITFGLLGELMTRTYHEAQNKPIYVVRQSLL
ncbi:MAG: glycosyltransferase family 2 protein [Gammaproteobacteria bacterium]|nr:glycosyltransferase family 2 protein [Gammaproteobacteria bacterium]